MNQILSAVASINDAVGNQKKVLSDRVINDIRRRKVDFPLTKENEKLLRDENAGNKLIEVIRQNSPPVPTPPASSKAIGMEFVKIPPGSFIMGSENGESDEKPVHRVTISREFWMQTTEVTQAQWKAVMRALPSNCDYGALIGRFLGDRKPIICVSWDDAQEFIRQLNAMNDGFKYRLPTEAEWEYAARAGTTEDDAGFLDGIAWYKANSEKSTQNVATKQANTWGVYDIRGNVWEWVADWYDESYYAKSPDSDPAGPTSGLARVFRGGSWVNDTANLRPAKRMSVSPSYRNYYLGFRVVRR